MDHILVGDMGGVWLVHLKCGCVVGEALFGEGGGRVKSEGEVMVNW